MKQIYLKVVSHLKTPNFIIIAIENNFSIIVTDRCNKIGVVYGN